MLIIITITSYLQWDLKKKIVFCIIDRCASFPVVCVGYSPLAHSVISDQTKLYIHNSLHVVI